MKVACATCGRVINKSPYHIAHTVHQYCSRPCQIEGRRRKTVRITQQGYVSLPGNVLEHRQVMADMLGRPLLPTEKVHHEDESRSNNLPDNLEVMTNAEHSKLHALARGYAGYNNPNSKYTDEQLLECFAYVEQGHTLKQASRKYSVGYATLRSVHIGKHRAYLLRAT